MVYYPKMAQDVAISWLHQLTDEHPIFCNQITSLSKACNYYIRHLHYIRPYFNLSTSCTTATFIVHSKLDYCNSLYHKLPKSQLSHLQQIQNSLAVIKALKSYHSHPTFSTGSKSLKALNTSSSHLRTKFLQLPNLHTSLTPCLFKILAVLAPHASLLLLCHRHHPL